MSDELPQGWTSVTLADLLAEMRTGPFGSALHKSDYVDSGIPIINPINIVEGRIAPSGNVTVSKSTFARLRDYALQTNDIIIARRGEMGRCAIVTDAEAGYLCGTGSAVLRLNECAIPSFVQKLISSSSVRAYLSDASVGTTMENLNQRMFKAMPLTIPPVAEQRRIVAKLEKLLGQVNACQQRLEKMPTLLKRFRQSILAAACSGRLTADWREENDLDDEWPVKPLSEFFEMRNGKSLVATKRQEGEIPVFGGNGLMGTHNAANAEGLVIVIGRVGAQCGNVHYVTGKVWVTDNAISLQGKKQLVPAFYAYFLRSLNLNTMSAGTGQPYVSQEILGPIETPVVSLAEQQEIVRRVAGLFALADQLEQRLAQARKQVDKLTPSLLARAFAGKLVPQNPTDEPAKKLLDRIKETKS